MTDHFNEALNPSIFTELFGLHAFVRRTVRSEVASNGAGSIRAFSN
jgi:hypothetical protein